MSHELLVRIEAGLWWLKNLSDEECYLLWAVTNMTTCHYLNKNNKVFLYNNPKGNFTYKRSVQLL